MFKTYQDIFNQRGILYHQAMVKYPLARADEFNQIIKLSELQDNLVICDAPSGGCYLSNFIEPDLKIISIETSKEFIKNSENTAKNTIILCENLGNIPLESGYLDRILSLAGLHHVDSKIGFYQEAYRLLKPTGMFCIADALENSKVAQFLDIFVDQYNSMGHQGSYLTSSTKQELESVGFEVVHDASIDYNWQFDSVASMANYCQLLFCIDRAQEQQIVDGIEKYLGYHEDDGRCSMNWELHFIKGIKTC